MAATRQSPEPSAPHAGGHRRTRGRTRAHVAQAARRRRGRRHRAARQAARGRGRRAGERLWRRITLLWRDCTAPAVPAARILSCQHSTFASARQNARLSTLRFTIALEAATARATLRHATNGFSAGAPRGGRQSRQYRSASTVHCRSDAFVTGARPCGRQRRRRRWLWWTCCARGCGTIVAAVRGCGRDRVWCCHD